MWMAARIQLVLQIDQGNLDGMRELASTDTVYIADAGAFHMAWENILDRRKGDHLE